MTLQMRVSTSVAFQTLLALTLGAGVASYARADANPYILLYEARVTIAKADVERTRALNEFHRRVYERDRRLYEQRAVSLEELQKAESEYEAGLAATGGFVAKVSEAEAMVAIVKLRVAAGETIPICTSGD